MASRYRKEDAVTLAPRGWDSHPHEHTVIRIWFYPVLPSIPEHFYSFRKNESHNHLISIPASRLPTTAARLGDEKKQFALLRQTAPENIYIQQHRLEHTHTAHAAHAAHVRSRTCGFLLWFFGDNSFSSQDHSGNRSSILQS